jgi:hypothetical protein
VPPPASCTDHVTAVDCPPVVPVTVAVKVSEAPGVVAALLGARDTVMTGVAVTFTVATSGFDLPVTAAAMWNVPVDAGAL